MARTWTSAQEEAITTRGKTLLVSAAAGSGKTSVLTERIIRSLTDKQSPADLSRMLVVTFTRAAAAELKSRIATALTEALAADPGNRHLSRQLFLLGSAQISTIDSFFQRVVRENFQELSLPASFRIADPSEVLPLAEELLEELIEDFYRANAPKEEENLLSDMDRNAFANAMDHLMSHRSDGRLPSLLLEFRNSFAAEPEGAAVLERAAGELESAMGGEFFSSRHGSRLQAHLSELFEGYAAALADCDREISEYPDLYPKLSGLLYSDKDYTQGLLRALQEGYRATRDTLMNPPTGRFPTIREKPDAVQHYQHLRDAFKKDIKEAGEMLSPPPEALPEQLSATAHLARTLFLFYREFEKRYLAEKTSRGLLEYDDIRRMLYQLLTTPEGTPSPFALSLSERYDAVYIDEYQDVDTLQDRIFSCIGGNRRFMVGDIKQSIYGFRGSNPGIFAAYRRAMPLSGTPEAESAPGVCIFMSDNFRCDRPVIDFANRVCAFLFSACEETVGYRPEDDLVASKRMPETLPDGLPAPVECVIFDKSQEASEDGIHPEATWVAGEISRLLREGHLDDGRAIRPSDIVILVRNKAHGKPFLKGLEALGIPATASGGRNLFREPLMMDLVNLLRTIDNPLRDLPLSEYLISPLGGYTLEELTELRDGAEETASLYEAMCRYAEIGSGSLAQRTAALIARLEVYRSNAATLPADRFLNRLYQEDALRPYADGPILRFLYEQARIYQRSSWCGLYGFLSHINTLAEAGNVSADGFCKAEDAVTVMTVHHSKGLEFPVVFLSAIGAPFNKDDAKQKMIWRPDPGFASVLYHADTGNTETTVLRHALKLQTEQEGVEESIRTLYVALTRARERMYVTGTLRGRWEKASTAASLIRRGDRTGILGASSYLHWILAALQSTAADGAQACHLRHLSPEEAMPGVPWSTEDAADEKSAISPATRRYAGVLAAREAFAYPLSHLAGLPTKAAASKIYPELLDHVLSEVDSEEAVRAGIDLLQGATPDFDRLLEAGHTPSATEIGTATHAFLQFCDFVALRRDGIDAEAERLVREKFLSPETIRLLHRGHLERFLASELLETILSAKAVRREQTFGLPIPMRELTKKAELAASLGDATIFIQGSIDLLLEMPDGRLLLYDYKTDRILPGEQQNPSALAARMQREHGMQLSTYSRAVHTLFGRLPDAVYIYSIPLGRNIEIL